MFQIPIFKLDWYDTQGDIGTSICRDLHKYLESSPHKSLNTVSYFISANIQQFSNFNDNLFLWLSYISETGFSQFIVLEKCHHEHTENCKAHLV